MSITNHNNQMVRILAIASLGLLVLSGCQRSALEAANRKVMPGLSQPVRVSSGDVYVAWLDERNVSPIKDMNMDAKAAGHHMESNREVFIAASRDGGRSFSRNQRVATNACPCCKTALATTSDGRVYLSWRQVLPGDFRHIAVASSSDHTQTFTTPVTVSDDQWVLSGCPVSGAALFAGNDGSVRVLWYSEGKNGEADAMIVRLVH